ncbi:MAG: type IX secretion system plug protein domain-containing protein [Flavobacteriaceae bacterium]
MIEKIVSLIIFFFIVNPVFTQLNNVKSIKVESNGNLNSNIVFYKNDIINISFDILGGKKSDYYYQVTHCDYQWNPSKISKLEYIDGFDDIRITNYVFSKNTFQSFTNFSFQIPNENLKIKIDGNYVIKIFDENYNEIFERKIIILNNLTNGLVNITRSKEILDSSYSQNIQALFSNTNNIIFNNNSDYKLAVIKNNNLNSSKYFSSPRLQTGSKIIYDNIKFKGGSEYLYFDSKNILSTSNEIKQVNFKNIYNTILYDDYEEPIYTLQPDINGTYIINANCSEKKTCADYTNVKFNLRTNKNYASDIYLIGEFNGHEISEQYKMKKYDGNFYSANLILKQGIYNYKYVFKTNSGFEDLSNFWQTENNYKAILYEKKITDRYYKIIGYGEKNSNNIVN